MGFFLVLIFFTSILSSIWKKVISNIDMFCPILLYMIPGLTNCTQNTIKEDHLTLSKSYNVHQSFQQIPSLSTFVNIVYSTSVIYKITVGLQLTNDLSIFKM